jgi:type IV secretory pathway component VirB8
MLGEQQRRQRQHQFTDDVAAFKANPSNEIDVKVAAVTILSSDSLKTAQPHHAVIDFEKATTANGVVTKRELWVATLDFMVGADVENDLAGDNPLGLTITALREEPVL